MSSVAGPILSPFYAWVAYWVAIHFTLVMHPILITELPRMFESTVKASIGSSYADPFGRLMWFEYVYECHTVECILTCHRIEKTLWFLATHVLLGTAVVLIYFLYWRKQEPSNEPAPVPSKL